MRAVTYDEYGPIDRLQIREVPDPKPGRSEILVSVRFAALNPKDAVFRRGRFARVSGRKFPKFCGLDFAGSVVASRSPHFSIGQRVFGALNEWRFLRGTLAERVCVRDHEAALLSSGVAEEAAAAIALTGLTALQALRDIGRVQAGARVLIHGASGGVGTAAIQIARALGTDVVTTSSARNLELCTRLGASDARDYADQPFAALPRMDVVFDAFGNLSRADIATILVGGGVYISTIPTLARLVRDRLTRWRFIQERLVVVRPRRIDLELLSGWLQDGTVSPVIDSRYPLSQVHDAFRVLESKRARGKIVIEV
jgi:NADPH:quinone reductase-like Zn-dependent oxidoreductase